MLLHIIAELEWNSMIQCRKVNIFHQRKLPRPKHANKTQQVKLRKLRCRSPIVFTYWSSCYYDQGRSFLWFVGQLPHQIAILPHFDLQDLVALKINILDIPTDEKSRVSYKLNDCSPCLTKVEWKDRWAVDSYQLWTGHCSCSEQEPSPPAFAKRPWTRRPDASNGTSPNVRP